MYKKILLPTDGSSYADQEVERVTKLLADDGEVIILSVAGKLKANTFQRHERIKKANERLKREAEANVKHMASKFDDSLNVTPMVRIGFPADTIIQVADEENIDLIIISSSGKSGIHRFILGSVTEDVLKKANTDVLLVHND